MLLHDDGVGGRSPARVDLERHAPSGGAVRVLQRILALTAATPR